MTWKEFRKENGGSYGENLVGWRIKVAGVWYLIGDINCLGGTCDDCMAFYDDAEIEEMVKPTT